MARELVEHVVEEADAGRDVRLAGAVEVDGDVDRGLVGFARNGAFAHGLAFEWQSFGRRDSKPRVK